VLKTSKFTMIVNRLFIGLILTKTLMVPSTEIVTNIFSKSLNETGLISSFTRPIVQEMLMVFNSIGDANEFSENLDLSKLGNRMSIEKILGYLIFMSLIWDSPIFFGNYLLLLLDKMKKANKTNDLKKISLRSAKYFAPTDTVVWKQNPNNSSEATFPISNKIDFAEQKD
jgi:hypothetical protein